MLLLGPAAIPIFSVPGVELRFVIFETEELPKRGLHLSKLFIGIHLGVLSPLELGLKGVATKFC